ncbi:cyclin-like protein [Scheffersomyces coipomensis]|uniref:cyclin-like protein n=1 Tax=Scheffersomyces coipomensis TaxID=1788519 RepID=UPI00315CEE99
MSATRIREEPNTNIKQENGGADNNNNIKIEDNQPKVSNEVDNSNLETNIDSWLFSEKSFLESSPSRQVLKLTIPQELKERDSSHQFIIQIGSKLKLDSRTILAASIYINRVFMRIPIKKSSKQFVACAAIALACKLHDTYRTPAKIALEAAIVASPGRVVDEQSQVFWMFRDQLLYREEVILKTLNFDLNIELPYNIRDDLIKESAPDNSIYYSKKQEILRQTTTLIELLSSLPIFVIYDTYTVFGMALILIIIEARSKFETPDLKLPKNYLRIKLQVDANLCYQCFEFIQKLLKYCDSDPKAISNKSAKKRIRPVSFSVFKDAANEED